MNGIFKNMFVRLSLLTMILFFTVLFVTLRLENNDLQSEADRLQMEIETVTESIHELKHDLDRPFDEEYISEIAHEKLSMCYPQEIIYSSGDGD